MTAALNNSIYYSDSAVAKLRELEQERKTEEFIDFLAKVMEHGWLDETDCHNIMVICHRLNPEIEKVFLKYATEAYEYEEMRVQYADTLSNDRRTHDQALLIANETIGLVKRGNVYDVTKVVTEKLLAAFFNVYLHLKKHEELLQICEVLLKKYKHPQMMSLIYRNMATCYLFLEQYDASIEVCNKAIEIEDTDIIHHRLFTVYHRTGEYVKAFHELEIANSLDPDDGGYYRMLAGLVIDEHIARTSIDQPAHPISRSQVRDYALPYIIYAASNHIISPNNALDFLRKNIQIMKEDIARFIQAVQTETDLFEEFSDLDFSIVNYSATNGFRNDS